MREIPLTKGKVALVDDEDFERVNQYKWQAHESNGTWYANTTIRIGINKRKCLIMHRFILNITDPKVRVDHKFHDGLNNQKEFLRIVTHSQNCMNRKRTKKSGYKGVFFKKHKSTYIKANGEKSTYDYGSGTWISAIRVNKKLIRLGSFKNEEEAARAYDEAALKHFKEFACLNFPKENYALAV